MNRLVQGDVGSGKTMVALLAMVVALENGYQAAFMAPTEILAEQHFLTFKRLLARCPYRVELLTSRGEGHASAGGARARWPRASRRSRWARTRSSRRACASSGSGWPSWTSSTASACCSATTCARKGYDADVLVMTATPIPRTLALTAYGDLDVSVVDERPPGRTPIRTVHRPASERRGGASSSCAGEVAAGRQAYVVYPLVEESEKLEDVQGGHRRWREEWRGARCRERAVGLLHGRLKSAGEGGGDGRVRRAARSRCWWPPP